MHQMQCCILVVSLTIFNVGASYARQRHLIIGGKLARENVTFVAGLRSTKEGANFCGGTLIDRDRVLTAAHCVYDNPNVNWIALGNSAREGCAVGECIEVESTRVHDRYDHGGLYDYDFAILKLKRPSVFDPIHLAPSDSGTFEHANVTVFGWGKTAYFGQMSDQLKELQTQVVSNDECVKSFGSAEISDRMLCAVVRSNAFQDTFSGDSGGPMVYYNGNQEPLLVGVVSWAKAPKTKGSTWKPSVYARVSAYHEAES